jgi:hypothetical protein
VEISVSEAKAKLWLTSAFWLGSRRTMVEERSSGSENVSSQLVKEHRHRLVSSYVATIQLSNNDLHTDPSECLISTVALFIRTYLTQDAETSTLLQAGSLPPGNSLSTQEWHLREAERRVKVLSNRDVIQAP